MDSKNKNNSHFLFYFSHSFLCEFLYVKYKNILIALWLSNVFSSVDCLPPTFLFYFMSSSVSALLFVGKVFIIFPDWQLVFFSKAKAEQWRSVPHLFIAWLSTIPTHSVINNIIAKSHKKSTVAN